MSGTAEIQQQLERYINAKLLTALDCTGSSFALRQTNLGINSRVFYLDIAGRPPLVVKAIRKRDRFKTLLDCSAYLAKKGITVPGIVYSREDGRLFKRIGMHIICEERVMGDTLYDHKDSPGLIADAARLFARMHTITRNTWGKIHENKTDGLYAYLLKKLQHNLEQWQRHDASFSGDLQTNITLWVQPWEQEVNRIARFSLSHGDPNPGNIILNAEGKLFLLDIGHIRYLPRAVDFYTLQLNLCEDSEEKHKIFEDAYCEGMTAEDHKALEETKPLFRVYVLTNFAAMLARRLAATAPEQPYHEDYVAFLEKAKVVIAEIIH